MFHPSFHARATSDKIAYQMLGTGAAITYSELDRRSNQGAQLFRTLGLRPGDHIAFLLENSIAFLVICWAAQRSGLFYTAISRYLKPDEIAYIVRDCGARVFITSPYCAPAAQALIDQPIPELTLFTTGAPALGFESWDEALAEQPQTPIDDEAVGNDMLYSSGTTGKPKGVEREFAFEPLGTVNPLLQLLCVNICGMGPETIYLSPAPLYHAAPLRFNMSVAALGGTSIIMERFEPEAYLRAIEAHRVTHSQLVPTMFVRLLKMPDEIRRRYDVSSLRAAIHAAAPCPVDVKAQMIDWWGPILVEYYAGTEANGVTICTSSDWLAHRGTVGRSLVGAIKIVDDLSGAELPPRQIGSVYFAGGPQFAYHNDPE